MLIQHLTLSSSQCLVTLPTWLGIGSLSVLEVLLGGQWRCNPGSSDFSYPSLSSLRVTRSSGAQGCGAFWRRRKQGRGTGTLDIASHLLINNFLVHRSFPGSLHRSQEDLQSIGGWLAPYSSWKILGSSTVPHQPAFPRDKSTSYCIFHREEGRGLVTQTQAGSGGLTHKSHLWL